MNEGHKIGVWRKLQRNQCAIWLPKGQTMCAQRKWTLNQMLRQRIIHLNTRSDEKGLQLRSPVLDVDHQQKQS